MTRRVYVDTSTLLKRVVDESDAEAARGWMRAAVRRGDLLVSSSLAWVEVSRALRQLAARGAAVRHDAAMIALSGLGERRIGVDVIALARRIGPDSLRSLDAIHLASAVLVDADVMITHDAALLDAARALQLHALTP